MSKSIKYILIEVLIVVCMSIVACLVMFPTIVYAEEETKYPEKSMEIVEENPKTSWTVYIEEEIIPGMILIITAIGSIYLVIAPILSKVKKSSGLFESATKGVNAATNKTIENEKKVASLEERLDKIEKATTNTEQIIRLGFCNLEELVTKGYANEISKVGGENDDGNIKE